MAETGRLTAPATAPLVSPVTLVRIAIMATILVTWEAVAASGLLFRDVVPSLLVIGRALVELLADKTYYWHLGVTAGEIGTGLRSAAPRALRSASCSAPIRCSAARSRRSSIISGRRRRSSSSRS